MTSQKNSGAAPASIDLDAIERRWCGRRDHGHDPLGGDLTALIAYARSLEQKKGQPDCALTNCGQCYACQMFRAERAEAALADLVAECDRVGVLAGARPWDVAVAVDRARAFLRDSPAAPTDTCEKCGEPEASIRHQSITFGMARAVRAHAFQRAAPKEDASK